LLNITRVKTCFRLNVTRICNPWYRRHGLQICVTPRTGDVCQTSLP